GRPLRRALVQPDHGPAAARAGVAGARGWHGSSRATDAKGTLGDRRPAGAPASAPRRDAADARPLPRLRRAREPRPLGRGQPPRRDGARGGRAADPRGYSRLGPGMREEWEGEEAFDLDPVQDTERRSLE